MLTGKMIIGADLVQGPATTFRAINPATGAELEPSFGGGGKAEVDRACDLAWAAFDTYRETSLEARAVFLETAAQEILDIGDALVERAMAESGLTRGRTKASAAAPSGSCGCSQASSVKAVGSMPGLTRPCRTASRCRVSICASVTSGLAPLPCLEPAISRSRSLSQAVTRHRRSPPVAPLSSRRTRRIPAHRSWSAKCSRSRANPKTSTAFWCSVPLARPSASSSCPSAAPTSNSADPSATASTWRAATRSTRSTSNPTRGVISRTRHQLAQLNPSGCHSGHLGAL
jgi:hypothetical protein